MKTKSLMLGAAATLSLAALALAPANAETSGTDHAAAVEACSAINPLQPAEAIGAVDDGSGIGFSLVWLNDAKGQLWMCDADTQGNVYSYSFVNDDLLEGAGPELIGLQPASDGGYEDYLSSRRREDLRSLSARRWHRYVEPSGRPDRRSRLRDLRQG